MMVLGASPFEGKMLDDPHECWVRGGDAPFLSASPRVCKCLKSLETGATSKCVTEKSPVSRVFWFLMDAARAKIISDDLP